MDKFPVCVTGNKPSNKTRGIDPDEPSLTNGHTNCLLTSYSHGSHGSHGWVYKLSSYIHIVSGRGMLQ